MENIEHWLRTVEQRALCNKGVVSTTYWMARWIIDRGIPGDFVECGVFAGAHCAAMARACMDAGAMNRRVHLFDSFEGIPLRGADDEDLAALLPVATDGDDLCSSGVSVCSLEDVKDHMSKWGIDASLLVYHPGWFQDTLPECGLRVIAMLRLDADLYESTRLCMQHLYPKLSKGGWCIVDDWNLGGCRKAIAGYFASQAQAEPAPMYWQA